MIKYLKKDKEYNFDSNWLDLEIINKQTASRSPITTMILKKDRKRVFRLFSNINGNLTSKQMDLLIDNLNELKNNASR